MKSNVIGLCGVALAVFLFVAVLPVSAQQGNEERAARLKAAVTKPTPRLPDGHPDLTGFWAEPSRSFTYTRSADGKTIIVGDLDAPELDQRGQPLFKIRAADPSRHPKYKPQFQKKWRELMFTANRVDLGIHCYPQGVPRIGAPTEIMHTPTTVYLLYGAEGRAENEDPTHTFRIIPIGGKHDPERDPRPEGDSIAYWDGDTLVVDVVNLDPDTWLDGDGTFHDENLHVVERFTRKGDTLEYDVTIDDPTMFTEPWKPVAGVGSGRIGSTTRIARQPGEHLAPDFPCVERDREHKVNNDRQ